jgi:Fe2+ transport system protein FeoA
MSTPVAVSLAALSPGDTARLFEVSAPRRTRFAHLGLVPGVEIEVVQLRPALVLRAGPLLLALDAELAQEVLVTPIGA